MQKFLCVTTLNFYPRPPRGGRPYYCSIGVADVEFLSTPSARRATDPVSHRAIMVRISIHALREEGDSPRIKFVCA